MSVSPVVLEIPDLAGDGWRIRGWEAGDAGSLVRAWHDPAIIAGSTPPDDRSEDAAARWIAGCDERRLAGRAFDVVAVDEAGEVLGEFGLSRFDAGREAAVAGWWIHAEARGRGVGGAMVEAMTEWLLSGPFRALLAEIDPANAASVAVARRAGFALLGDAPGADDGRQVWAARRASAPAT